MTVGDQVRVLSENRWSPTGDRGEVVRILDSESLCACVNVCTVDGRSLFCAPEDLRVLSDLELLAEVGNDAQGG